MAGSQGTEFSYIGKGSIYIKVKGSTDPLRPIGNCDELTFRPGEEKKTLGDFQNSGGGAANTLRRITGVEMGFRMRDFIGENIALALFGASTNVASGSATNEAVVSRLGSLVPLAKIGPTVTAVTNVAGTTTYVAGTDYEVTAGGLWIPTASAIPAGDTIHVDYTYGAQSVVQALTTAGKDYQMRFSGLNEAQSGKAVVIDVHRFRAGPTQEMALIGDDYAALPVNGDALKDTDVTAGGLSQYFVYTYVP